MSKLEHKYDNFNSNRYCKELFKLNKFILSNIK